MAAYRSKKTPTRRLIGSSASDGDEPQIEGFWELIKTSDACGEMEFGSNTTKTAKYIKVANSTKFELLYQVLTKHWKLKTPNLIISVTGGAKNFTLRTRLKEMFRKSLIKAAESTGAWITTGGTHAGVMKHVGKAVQNYAAITDDQNRAVTVGIAPWGVIHDKHKLRTDKSLKTPTIYDAEESLQGANTVLDCNHSHFILVDDGSEGEYGREIKFRTDFESFLAHQQAEGEVNVMIVCVIVQGGPGSLETVAGSIEIGTPVVIVGGSGGWADILAEVDAMDVKSLNVDVLKQLLIDHDMEPISNEQLHKLTAMVNKCISKKNLLSVFTLDASDLTRDLDIAILGALLKAKEESGTRVRERLKLAMTWNRSDIARSHIFTDDVLIEKKDIAEMFFSALRHNKHNFCKVFLDYGVDLKEYCTVEEMKNLYRSAPEDSIVYQKLCTDSDFFPHKVERLMVQFLGHSYISVYPKKGGTKRYSATNEKDKMDDPHREIFQWAILVNYQEIAMHIWEYMFGPMAAAIAATKILKAMAAKMLRDHEKRNQMLAAADQYEVLAAGILGQCFVGNPKKTVLLLIGCLPKWGGYTCLRVAMEADDKLFVSQPGVQTFFDRVWNGKLADDTSMFHILLAGVCPLFIFATMDFKVDESIIDNFENKSSVKRTVDSARVDNNEMSILMKSQNDVDASTSNADSTVKVEGTLKTRMCFIKKLDLFYNVPIVTFWMNVLAFLVYLMFFAFVILSDFCIKHVSVSNYEYVLVGWISTFLLEELRQALYQEARFMKQKIKLYLKDPWNMMDLASLTLFYTGFVLRWFEQFLDTALILYTMAFMCHCIHIVHIFAVYPVLGPKIIMVGKMLKDLLFFLFILVVFLLAYGVASQALLYPTEKNFADIIVGVIYRPYWQIYGELFLEEVNYNPNLDDFTCSSTNASLPRCPQQSVTVPIISAIYLLLSNVLLLNLLIAMFSYTFKNVEEQGNKIWMFQRYKLITHYYLRPPLVPPFIILSHIYLFFAFLKRKLSKKMKGENSTFHALEKHLDKTESEQLKEWERWHAEAYIRVKREEDNAKMDFQLGKLSDRIDNVASSIEDMQDRLQRSCGGSKSINNPPKRKKYEEDVVEAGCQCEKLSNRIDSISSSIGDVQNGLQTLDRQNSAMLKRFENLEKMIKTLSEKGESAVRIDKAQSEA